MSSRQKDTSSNHVGSMTTVVLVPNYICAPYHRMVYVALPSAQIKRQQLP